MTSTNFGTAKCGGCKNILPASMFSKSRTSSNGLQGWCKKCIYPSTPKSKRKLLAHRKSMLIAHYSDGSMCCTSCGFSDIRALTLDHKKGGGSKERRESKVFGGKFYKQLIDNNFPIGYQVLCMNCQFIKRHTNKEWRKANVEE